MFLTVRGRPHAVERPTSIPDFQFTVRSRCFQCNLVPLLLLPSYTHATSFSYARGCSPDLLLTAGFWLPILITHATCNMQPNLCTWNFSVLPFSAHLISLYKSPIIPKNDGGFRRGWGYPRRYIFEKHKGAQFWCAPSPAYGKTV